MNCFVCGYMNTCVIYYAVKHDLIPLLFCFQIVSLYLRVTAISAITKISRINLFIYNRHGLLLLQFVFVIQGSKYHCTLRRDVCTNTTNIISPFYWKVSTKSESAMFQLCPWYYDLSIRFWNCFANFVFNLSSIFYIGSPIIGHRNMSLFNGRVALSIYVFSDPRITDIVWMR